MLFLQNDDHTRGLGVEGTGDIFDGVGNELFDTGVRDGGLIGDLVVSATVLDSFEKAFGVCHF